MYSGSSKSENGSGTLRLCQIQSSTSCFKGVATEELPARNGNDLEIMDIGNLKSFEGSRKFLSATKDM